jgi:endo-1,4-beta-xylanase
MQSWDVVNEVFNENGTFRQSFWFNTLGSGFIADAFRFARAADPDARLCINDYNVEGINDKSTAMYNLVQSLRSQGVPVDCVGFQAHLAVQFGFPGQFTQNIARFAALGVQVRITELDVRIPLPADANEIAAQNSFYSQVINGCLGSAACAGVTIWGFTDRHSWVPGTFPGEGQALIYDANYNQKPAYTAVHDALAAGGGGGSTFNLVSSASNRCVDVSGASQSDGAGLIIWDCHTNANQRWTQTAANELRVYNNSKCMDAGASQNGTRVTINSCNGGNSQKWTLNANGTVVNVQSGRCLDVSGAGAANNTPVIVWTCHGGSNQVWTRRS